MPLFKNNAKRHFAHFLPFFVTKVIFAPSKSARISERSRPRPQITHKKAQKANPLYITDFGDIRPKNEHRNRQTDHKNQGKRPTITP